MLFFAWTSYSVLTFLELLEFQNMGFIFSHLKGFPFSALFVIPPCGEIVVFVTLNFRKDLDLFDFAIVVSKNLLISKSFVFFLTICSFLYSFFIRFSMNRSSTQSLLCWSVWVDSNHRPRAYQARALTTWATDRYCSGSLSDPCLPGEVSFAFGGDDGNRTHDPLLAGQVLSQLSYTPIKWGLLSFLMVTQNWTTMKDVLS